MNREIKCRGKTQVTNGFVLGYYIRQYGCKNGKKFFTDFIYSEDEIYYPIDINTLGQYTGLKDKNGVEIYEGDIVKCEKINPTYSLKIGVAEFNDTDLGSGGCCFHEFFSAGFVIKTVKTKNDNGKYFSMYDLEKCEVIGNIYEDKELLND